MWRVFGWTSKTYLLFKGYDKQLKIETEGEVDYGRTDKAQVCDG